MKKQDGVFLKTVHTYYRTHGRHTLPWRKTRNPYRILVSEIMLQQTQVERVIPKYQAFLKQFPTVGSLADATLGEVLIVWQGLGYNRRAKMLKQAAHMIVDDYNGRWPKTYEGLRTLPGVGPYTAGAISAFAFNIPVPMIETNIRTVYLHHYFPNTSGVSDAQLLPLITRTLDTKNPREWYAALMDYGSHLKVTVGNVSKQSRHHTVQKAFKGSDREIRGAIIKALTTKAMTTPVLLRALKQFDEVRILTQVTKLQNEGLLMVINRRYTLPT